MKERKRRQSLGGAVLIMVLTVMFILMILLMAAMTTVSTANQRIFTKFEENQAYYTARSALDVFVQNMIADKKYIAYNDGGNKVAYKYGDNKTADMKQGLGLQIDVYSITAQNGMNIKQSDLVTAAGNISVAADKKDEYKNYFGVKPSGTDINEIYYEVELPKTADASKAYGMLSDRVGGESKAKIKIEVLKRKYDVGTYSFTTGSHNGTDIKTFLDTLGDDELTRFFSEDTTIPVAERMTANEAKDIAAAIIKGNRKKDTMQLKITATTTYRGVEGTAVLIIDSNEPPANNSSRAITAFGGTGSDNMSILGGMAAENTINWGSNDGYIYGPVYVEDDFLMTSNGPKIHLNSGETLVVGGDMQLANSGHFQVTNETSPMIVDDKNAPFVYVGGEIRVASDIENPFMNVDVIAESFTANAKVVLDSSSRVYCKGFTSHCVSNSTYNGDIYVDGNVTIYSDNDTKITYGGDGSPSVVHGGTGTIHFTGNIIDGNTGNIVTSGAGAGFVKETTSFWSNIPEPSKIANNNPTAVAGDDGTKIEFQIPGRTQKKQIETHTKNFDTYYVKDADGNRVMVTVPNPVGGGTVQKPQVKSAQVMADISTMGDKTKPFTSAYTGITENLSAKVSAGGSFYGETFNYVLDTSGADVSCKWNFDNKKIYIKGGGTVVLQLDNESKSGGYSNDNLILVDDDTTLKIIGDTDSIATGTWDNTFVKLEVYNQTTWGAYKGHDAGEGVDSLKVGSKSGVGIKVPKIFYYFTGSGTFSVQNNCLLTGYVYAPDAKIDMHAASTPSPSSGMEYNGGSVSGANVCIVGSALVKGAEMPNNTGVAYINPDLDDDTPGEPIHHWQSFQYIRG